MERLVKGVGLSKAEAIQRIQNQIPLAEKRNLADWVIDNSGSMELHAGRPRPWYWHGLEHAALVL